MGHFPRIETANMGWFITTKTALMQMWFVNNSGLQEDVLRTAAKLIDRYGVKLYMLSIRGNHIHMVMQTPQKNRKDFMRDFNSQVAKAVPMHVPAFPGGRVWKGRYSGELLPLNEDIERQYWYGIFQAVQDGLVDDIKKDPNYNCFEDSITGKEFEYTFVKQAEYNAARRYNKNIDINKYTYKIKFKFERLPGYEELPQDEYERMMRNKYEGQRLVAMARREEKGATGYAGVEVIKAIEPGAVPLNPKVSTRTSKRPRVLCANKEVWCYWLSWLLSKVSAFREASKRFRTGDFSVAFPDGMYRPYSGPTT